MRALAAASVVLALTLPASAAAAPPGLTLGFSGGADVALASGNPATQAFWVPRAQAVGAQMVRLDVSWSAVAPSHRPHGFAGADPNSPGYDWTQVDRQVRELSAAHFSILIDVDSAPAWAEGAAKPASAPAGTWRPSAAAFGAFATAIANRYDGSFADPLNPGADLPRVQEWQGWNEPNIDTYLTPQWVRTSGGRYQPASPVIYRALQNAFYASVKRVSASDYVLAAGTGPYGDLPGGRRIQPVAFDRVLFCLNDTLTATTSCPDPVHLDAIDHHPYGIDGPNWHALNADDAAVPDIDKLTAVLNVAERRGTVLPRGAKAVWVTEISWDTKPPDPHGVPIQLQARWLEQSLFVLWQQGVSTVLWWQLVDSPPVPNYGDSYQAGVYYLHGGAKPGAAAFRFPFISTRVTRQTVEAWGRAPISGIVSIERRSAGVWHVIGRMPVRAAQVFERPISLAGSATLRATVGSETSLTWSQTA